MGNFAENLNLGNRFRPPPLKILECALILLWYSATEEWLLQS